ncbi:MAG: hypothetical protein LBP26_02165 [Clostridiales bacterium]|jgi:hypothetical protein|nr:hypothetical protein [Clostridiales bacterium]
MKKNKLFSAVAAMVLAAAVMFGCAAPSVKLGKKYDAVYGVYDNFTVVAQKGGAMLYNGSKKVTKKPYFSIEPVYEYATTSDGITQKVADYTKFFARQSASGGYGLLDSATGAYNSYGDGVTKITPHYAVVRSGGFNVPKAVVNGYTVTLADGKKFIISASGAADPGRYDSVTATGRFRLATKTELKDDTDTYATKTYLTTADGAVIASDFDATRFHIHEDDSNRDLSVARVTLKEPDANGNTMAIYAPSGNKIADVSDYEDDWAGYVSYSVNVAGGKTEYYLVDGSYNPKKFVDMGDIVTTADGKSYVLELNEAGDKVRLVEPFGTYESAYYEDIEPMDANGDETEDSPAYFLLVNGGKVTITDGRLNTVFTDLDYDDIDEIGAADPDDLPPGNIAVYVKTANKISVNLNGTVYNKTYTEGDTVIPHDFAFEIAGADKKELWAPLADKTTEFDSLDQEGFYYKIGKSREPDADGKTVVDYYVCESENLRFWRGGVDITDPNDNNYNIMSALGISAEKLEGRFSIVSYGGTAEAMQRLPKGDYANVEVFKNAFVNVVAGVNYIKLNYTTDEDGTRSRTVLSYGAVNSKTGYKYIDLGDKTFDSSPSLYGVFLTNTSGRGTAYKIVGSGDSLKFEPVLEYSDGATFMADAFANTYIAVNVSGKTAVYDGDGKLILDPRYTVASTTVGSTTVMHIANGNALVQQGDYYGVVKMGKKPKLIKKFSYNGAALFPDGSFTLTQKAETAFYNAKGKALAKKVGIVAPANNVYTNEYILNTYAAKKTVPLSYYTVGYANGKQSVLTLELAEKNLDYSAFNNTNLLMSAMLGSNS